mmetsp:Transcript_82583/g.191881  ORF Transcript_82583/g.191881 Transcript_82583/m.191881 type:complete len:90 (+) Transcript_82583:321-590(+)
MCGTTGGAKTSVVHACQQATQPCAASFGVFARVSQPAAHKDKASNASAAILAVLWRVTCGCSNAGDAGAGAVLEGTLLAELGAGIAGGS